MQFLLQLLVTFWFLFILFQAVRLATMKSISEGKTKPTASDIILLMLCFIIIIYGCHYIWFGLEFKL